MCHRRGPFAPGFTPDRIGQMKRRLLDPLRQLERAGVNQFAR
jgi:hypothetical protein